MNLRSIEKKILKASPFIKKVFVTIQNGSPFATITPDFEALKEKRIVNIESQLRWYGIELYNMEADEDEKVCGYKILSHEKTSLEQEEPDDELYKSLKSFIASISHKNISPSSHLELDLGFDSLNYVELFIYVEESFGVYMDEALFSNLMILEDFYAYVKEHQTTFNPTKIDWEAVLSEEIDEKLIYSPWIIFAYKTLLLPFFKLYFRLEVKGLENIPNSSCIIAPTHQSMLDGFLIESTLPYKILKNTFFLAFEAVFGTKYLRPISNHGQTLLIDADNHLKLSMQRSALPLREQKNLVIFPEGARTRDKELLEFRPFFAMLSQTYKVPVVPVVIDGSFEALQAGKLFPRPKKIKITYLEPIYSDNMDYEKITKLVREAIEGKIKLSSRR
ncbi:MAG: glycerol acyltransferase [Helicobacteraceae bacterium CG2_30_36_10]|nr:MAG: glycerol acyltransferase [Helicobacteraceae bacterium CG2_30_36_10]